MDPIFILGNHRSGTTWLYQLLAETGHFSVLTASHVIDWPAWVAHRAGGPVPDAAALAGRFQELGIAARQGDEVQISPDLPEEYCYLLNNAGLGSHSSRKGLPMMAQILDVLGADGRPVLLKNPWDYSHFPFLAATYPGARFIFIHRHPLRVIHSTARMFRDMWVAPDPYGLLVSARYGANWRGPVRRRIFQWLAGSGLSMVIEGIALGVAGANRGYVTRLPSLPEQRRISLRYEDLCLDPNAQLAEILRFCGLPQTHARVPPRPGDSPLLPQIQARAARFGRAMGPYMTLHRYT